MQVVPAATTFGQFLTPVFFYVVIAAYMAFVLASAWQFSRRPEPGRVMRAINLTLVPLGVLVGGASGDRRLHPESRPGGAERLRGP